MLERDHIMRQVQQAAIALARAMLLRQNGRVEDAVEILLTALTELGDTDVGRLLAMTRTELIEHLRGNGTAGIDRMAAIADILYEYSNLNAARDPDRAVEARERAIWVYEECLRVGATVPLHVHERVGGSQNRRSSMTADPDDDLIVSPSSKGGKKND